MLILSWKVSSNKIKLQVFARSLKSDSCCKVMAENVHEKTCAYARSNIRADRKFIYIIKNMLKQLKLFILKHSKK